MSRPLPPNLFVGGTLMIYLVIGLVIGVTVDRYVLPLFDMLLEIVSYKVSKKCTEIQIDTNLMSLDYQEIADQGQQLTPTIGFLSGEQQEDDFYEDDEDEEEYRRKASGTKIGFIR
jgi:hypothetical protein